MDGKKILANEKLKVPNENGPSYMLGEHNETIIFVIGWIWIDVFVHITSKCQTIICCAFIHKDKVFQQDIRCLLFIAVSWLHAQTQAG